MLLCARMLCASQRRACQCCARQPSFHALCHMLFQRPRPSGLPRVAQVIGPHAARQWLAETAPALGLQYRFMACREFDALASAERDAILRGLGACSSALLLYSLLVSPSSLLLHAQLDLGHSVPFDLSGLLIMRLAEYLAHAHTVACGH